MGRLWLTYGRWLTGGAAVILIGGLYALTLAMSYRLPFVYDESIYLQIARRAVETGCPIIAEGDGHVFADSPPLVMYIMAAARVLGGDGLWWLRSVHVSVWVLPAYVAMFLLARRAFGAAAGLLALASFFTQQDFMREAAEVKLDVPVASLAALFLLGLSYVWAESGRRRGLAIAMCAVCGGLACLTKYQGALLPMTGILVLLIGRWMGPRPVAAARLPEVWLLAGAVVGGLIWFGLNSACGGNLVATLLSNLRRVTFQSSETWFHRPVLVYWSDLGRALGPVPVAGGIAGAVVWSGRLRMAPRVMLVVAWVVVTFVFCSAIGLRHERYFMPAVPALFVLVGALAAAETYDLPYLRHHLTAARVVRLGVVALVLVWTAVSLRATITGLADVARIGERSDTFYLRLAAVIRRVIPPEDRIMVSRPQTAYFAERNYFLSEYNVDGKALLSTLADPHNRITLIVQDSNQMLHPDMPAADQRQFWEYVQQHFSVSQALGGRVRQRTSW